jgi:hypothetical protein
MTSKPPEINIDPICDSPYTSGIAKPGCVELVGPLKRYDGF